MDDSIFVPMKVLNELRHQALEELEEQLLGRYRRALPGKLPGNLSKRSHLHQSLTFLYTCPVKIPRQERLLVRDPEHQRVYFPYCLMEKYLEKGLANSKEMYLSLPHITRGNPPEGYLEQIKKWLKQGMTGFLVRNLESYSRLRKLGLTGKCVLDHSLYTWNDEALAFWKSQGVLRTTVPLELNEKELRHRDNENSRNDQV